LSSVGIGIGFGIQKGQKGRQDFTFFPQKIASTDVYRQAWKQNRQKSTKKPTLGKTKTDLFKNCLSAGFGYRENRSVSVFRWALIRELKSSVGIHVTQLWRGSEYWTRTAW
jgi:hypothetical protein